MKATLKRADLLSAIASVKPCLGPPVSLPQISTVKKESFYALASGDRGLLLYATNSGDTLMAQLKAKVQGKGTMLLPEAAVKFLAAVDGKDVTLQLVHKVEVKEVMGEGRYDTPNGEWAPNAKFTREKEKRDFHTYGIKVEADGSHNSYPTVDPQQIQPRLPVKAYDKLAPITFRDISGPLAEVSYAMAGPKDNKPLILQGIALAKSPKGLDVVSTDGCRLALTTLKMKASIPQTFAVAASCVAILKGWKGRTTLKFRKFTKPNSKDEGYTLIFQNGPLTLQTDGTGGTYPNYRNVLPKDLQKGITVRKTELAQAVKVCSTVVGKDGTVRLVSKGRNLQVIGLAEGSESISKIPHRGRIQQAFPANHLMDMMAHVSEVVDLRHAKGVDKLGGESVAVIKNNGSLHLIMPFIVADWKRDKAKEKPFTGVSEATPVAHGNGAGSDDEYSDDLEGEDAVV